MSSDEETAAVSGHKRSRSAISGPIAPIAQPLAGKKLHKRIYKVVKKGNWHSYRYYGLVMLAPAL
jgi:hypothetical protein